MTKNNNTYTELVALMLEAPAFMVSDLLEDYLSDKSGDEAEALRELLVSAANK